MEDKKYSKLKAYFEATQPQMPTDFTDRVMERIKPRRRLVWLYPTIAAVAASALLFLTLHYNNSNVEPAVSPMVAQQQDSIAKVEDKMYIAHHVQSVQSPNTHRTKTVYKPKKASVKRLASPETPDTLGEGIWKQKENVVLALQMLAECEAAGEQIQRNTIVEAAFQSTLKPHHLQLVVSESGDYTVVDDSKPSIIEL